MELEYIKTVNDGVVIKVGKQDMPRIAEIEADMENGKHYSVDFKAKSHKRSLNANSYAWVLIGKIAEAVGMTKEEVYRKNIWDVGVYDVLEISEAAYPSFCETWKSIGLGWLIVPLSTESGYTSLLAFKGTSVYTTKQMGRYIDGLVAEAKALGLKTLPDNELASLKESWR